jgi:hypothetical protein
MKSIVALLVVCLYFFNVSGYLNGIIPACVSNPSEMISNGGSMAVTAPRGNTTIWTIDHETEGEGVFVKGVSNSLILNIGEIMVGVHIAVLDMSDVYLAGLAPVTSNVMSITTCSASGTLIQNERINATQVAFTFTAPDVASVKARVIIIFSRTAASNTVWDYKEFTLTGLTPTPTSTPTPTPSIPTPTPTPSPTPSPSSNKPPQVNHLIIDQTVILDTPFYFQIADDVFIDPDNDTLTYTAKIDISGDALPKWLQFNPSTRIFSGTPTETGTSTISITATDPYFLSASTSFTLNVQTSSQQPDTSPPIAAIVGGVIGGVIALGGVIILSYFIFGKSKETETEYYVR